MSELNDTEDEALAELIADLWVELARRPGVLRLAALQAASLIPEAGKISDRTLATHLGLSRHEVEKLGRRALLKAQSLISHRP